MNTSDQKNVKLKKNVFLDDFRVRQARALGINNFFDIVYLRAGDDAKTGNIHDFS